MGIFAVAFVAGPGCDGSGVQAPKRKANIPIPAIATRIVLPRIPCLSAP
jgi:hypothetical protein